MATELLEDELQAELKTRSLTHFQLHWNVLRVSRKRSILMPECTFAVPRVFICIIPLHLRNVLAGCYYNNMDKACEKKVVFLAWSRIRAIMKRGNKSDRARNHAGHSRANDGIERVGHYSPAKYNTIIQCAISSYHFALILFPGLHDTLNTSAEIITNVARCLPLNLSCS